MTFSIVAGGGHGIRSRRGEQVPRRGVRRARRDFPGWAGGDPVLRQGVLQGRRLALLRAGARAPMTSSPGSPPPTRCARPVRSGSSARTRSDLHRRRVPRVGRWGAGGDATDGWYAAQGNILTGPEVVAAMERAWLANPVCRWPAACSRHCWPATRRRRPAGPPRRRALCRRGRGGIRRMRGRRRPARRRPPAAARSSPGCWTSTTSTSGGRRTSSPLEGALADEVRDRLRRLGYRHTEGLDVAKPLPTGPASRTTKCACCPDGIDGKVLARCAQRPVADAHRAAARSDGITVIELRAWQPPPCAAPPSPPPVTFPTSATTPPSSP
jgi:hypothetical protein